jgi:VWFA-related protein
LPEIGEYHLSGFGRLLRHKAVWIFILSLAGTLAFAQDTPQNPPPQSDIPDAPSAVRPPQNFPGNLPPAGRPAPPPPAAEPGSSSSTPGITDNENTPPPPMPPVKTVPPGGAPSDVNSRDDLYTIKVFTNLVLVPVTVKDTSGHLVDGLLPQDFTVLEDGKKQTLKFFTSDPFPLSAAVIVDLGMSDAAVQKVAETYTALAGAFSPYDELALYTFSTTVSQVSDFSAVGKRVTAVLDQLKTYSGHNNGPPVLSGPLGPQGPTVNGVPVQAPGSNPMTPQPKDVRVLNDAVLRAALDLGKRDRARRKIIFIISEGREYGSKASYKDVLKVLLSQGVTVYAVGVEGTAIPGYGWLQKRHIPKYGYGDILPKYASATGGEMFTEFSRENIELAYAQATGDARNQYTLGYSAKATPSSMYRDIEVRVARSGLKVKAKSGYYPLPITK